MHVFCVISKATKQKRLTFCKDIYLFVVVNVDALAQASDFRIERTQVVIRTQRVSETQSPADWMPADKPTEL